VQDATAGSIVIGSEGLTVTTAAGKSARYSYFDDPTPLLEQLPLVLGDLAQVIPADEQVTNSRTRTSYAWGGFSVDVFESSIPPDSPFFRVVSETAAVGAVSIRTADGIAVGDGKTTIHDVADEDWVDSDGTETVHFYRVDSTPVPTGADDYPGPDAWRAVRVWVDESGVVATRIDAPVHNFGE
jgi:hypothetical protein